MLGERTECSDLGRDSVETSTNSAFSKATTRLNGKKVSTYLFNNRWKIVIAITALAVATLATGGIMALGFPALKGVGLILCYTGAGAVASCIIAMLILKRKDNAMNNKLFELTLARKVHKTPKELESDPKYHQTVKNFQLLVQRYQAKTKTDVTEDSFWIVDRRGEKQIRYTDELIKAWCELSDNEDIYIHHSDKFQILHDIEYFREIEDHLKIPSRFVLKAASSHTESVSSGSSALLALSSSTTSPAHTFMVRPPCEYGLPSECEPLGRYYEIWEQLVENDPKFKEARENVNLLFSRYREIYKRELSVEYFWNSIIGKGTLLLNDIPCVWKDMPVDASNPELVKAWSNLREIDVFHISEFHKILKQIKRFKQIYDSILQAKRNAEGETKERSEDIFSLKTIGPIPDRTLVNDQQLHNFCYPFYKCFKFRRVRENVKNMKTMVSLSGAVRDKHYPANLVARGKIIAAEAPSKEAVDRSLDPEVESISQRDCFYQMVIEKNIPVIMDVDYGYDESGKPIKEYHFIEPGDVLSLYARNPKTGKRGKYEIRCSKGKETEAGVIRDTKVEYWIKQISIKSEDGTDSRDVYQFMPIKTLTSRDPTSILENIKYLLRRMKALKIDISKETPLMINSIADSDRSMIHALFFSLTFDLQNYVKSQKGKRLDLEAILPADCDALYMLKNRALLLESQSYRGSCVESLNKTVLPFWESGGRIERTEEFAINAFIRWYLDNVITQTFSERY